MTLGKITDIQINEHGDETHESWLMVRANRISSTPGAHLFDSEIRHQHFIRVVISRGSRRRQLNHDWKHATKTLMEFDLSEAQWGAFVSSFGNGSGVPATLSFLDGYVPQASFTSRLDKSHREVKDAGKTSLEAITKAYESLQEAYDNKLGAKAIRERLHHLKCMIQNGSVNMEHVAKSLTEHCENVVTKARADIEGMALMAQYNHPALERVDISIPALEAGE